MSKSPFAPYRFDENRYDEYRSHEAVHLTAHVQKVYKISGVAEHVSQLDLKRGRELKDLLRAAGRNKMLARLALVVKGMGAFARKSAGPGDRCDIAVKKARAEYADHLERFLQRYAVAAERFEDGFAAGVDAVVLQALQPYAVALEKFRSACAKVQGAGDRVPPWLLDWFEQFFRIGWREARTKVNRRTEAIAGAMQRTPMVNRRGQRFLRLDTLLTRSESTDRVALHRLGKLFTAAKD
jgi:hypothetical protein